MAQTYDFDTRPYFQTVANALFRSHGDDALWMAKHAIWKMEVVGDEDGAAMWRGVMDEISKILGPEEIARQARPH